MKTAPWVACVVLAASIMTPGCRDSDSGLPLAPPNLPPVAVDDSALTDEDVPVDIQVLLNDGDPDPGDIPLVASATNGSLGTVSVSGDSTYLTYTPGADLNGPDTFTYTISDARGGVDTATVTVTVTAVNDAPTAVADAVSTALDAPITISVLANDTDPDADGLSIDSFTAPSEGSLLDNSDGTLTYTPPLGFTGFATFTYTATDPGGGTDTASVAVVVGDAITLTMTEAKGLFKPDGFGVGQYQAAYLSDDDNGRIYCNRVFDPADPTVTIWTKNRQYVEFTLDVQLSGGPWPGEARIVWTFSDPDDPSNEDVAAHAESHPTLDPNDYDGDDNDGDGTPDNSDGNDNTGGLDGLSPWGEVHADYALSNGNETLFTGGVSKVRFNVTDDGGDNFIVTAGVKLILDGEPYEPPSTSASTGVMTVWKRIDVEYVKMASAAPLDGLLNGQANDAFAKAFVELVPQAGAPSPVPDLAEMGPNEYAAGVACDEYVTAAAGEFTNEGKPGWFFASSANHFVDTGGGGGANLWEGTTLVLPDGLTMNVPIGQSLADDDRYLYGDKLSSVSFAGGYGVMETDLVIGQADLYKDGTVLYDYDPFADTYNASAPIISNTVGTAGAGNGAEITYAAAADAADGQILIYKMVVSAVIAWNPTGNPGVAIMDYESFSWHPTNETFRVWPKGYSTPTAYNSLMFNLHGYGFPTYSLAPTRVLGTGALVVQGISPGPGGGLEGRTIVFTAAGGDLDTLVHELGHAFGFHHICGNWDYMNDAFPGNCCTMHYSSLHFMLDHANPRRPDLWTYGTAGPYFCEEHAVAIRRQNLEDLVKLGWGN